VEDKFDGTVGGDVISFYMRNAGSCKSIVTLLLFTVVITLKVGADWFVGKWMNFDFGFNRSTYPLIYLAIVLGFGVFTMIRSFVYGVTAA
jgi:hypothetical protein